MDIIGFCGRIGCGKTTAARTARLYFGHEVVSFADPIRNMLITMGVSEEIMRDPEAKEEPLEQFGGKSARYLMQTLGTEWGRETVDPMIWVRAFASRLDPDDCIAIDDVRFDGEAEWIRSNGGKIYEIIRPDPWVKPEKHVSERGVSSELIDKVISNKGTESDFRREVVEVVGLGYDMDVELVSADSKAWHRKRYDAIDHEGNCP